MDDRKSTEFIRKTQLFEEKKFEGGVGRKGKLLEKPECPYKNFSEITSKLPSTSPGPSSKFKKRYIQQKLCVVARIMLGQQRN